MGWRKEQAYKELERQLDEVHSAQQSGELQAQSTKKWTN